jgi:hypothetical protein
MGDLTDIIESMHVVRVGMGEHHRIKRFNVGVQQLVAHVW